TLFSASRTLCSQPSHIIPLTRKDAVMALAGTAASFASFWTVFSFSWPGHARALPANEKARTDDARAIFIFVIIGDSSSSAAGPPKTAVRRYFATSRAGVNARDGYASSANIIREHGCISQSGSRTEEAQRGRAPLRWPVSRGPVGRRTTAAPNCRDHRV